MIPNKLEDVAQLLAPQWAAPLEMSAVGWLGDWRPSAILELLRSLARSSYLSSLADSAETDQILLQLIREIRIEEAIIDEEMGEVQATCILHLPFRPNNQTTSSFMVPLHSVQSQLKKIKQVITKAQQLRFTLSPFSLINLLVFVSMSRIINCNCSFSTTSLVPYNIL